MQTIKKILSYLWDIPIERTGSEQNEYLEVVWSMGRKMLNTKNANYSFGNGYKVFEFAFKQIKEKITNFKKVLVLGFGCGSVEHLLRTKYNSSTQITGVEYDPRIIELYKRHFSDSDQNTLVVEDDAKVFIESTDQVFDLIVIDLFDDLHTVPFVFEKEFTDQLLQKVNDSGVLIYNTVKAEDNSAKYTELSLQLNKRFKEVGIHTFQDINRIIIAK